MKLTEKQVASVFNALHRKSAVKPRPQNRQTKFEKYR